MSLSHKERMINWLSSKVSNGYEVYEQVIKTCATDTASIEQALREEVWSRHSNDLNHNLSTNDATLYYRDQTKQLQSLDLQTALVDMPNVKHLKIFGYRQCRQCKEFKVKQVPLPVRSIDEGYVTYDFCQNLLCKAAYRSSY